MITYQEYAARREAACHNALQSTVDADLDAMLRDPKHEDVERHIAATKDAMSAFLSEGLSRSSILPYSTIGQTVQNGLQEMHMLMHAGTALIQALSGASDAATTPSMASVCSVLKDTDEMFCSFAEKYNDLGRRLERDLRFEGHLTQGSVRSFDCIASARFEGKPGDYLLSFNADPDHLAIVLANEEPEPRHRLVARAKQPLLLVAGVQDYDVLGSVAPHILRTYLQMAAMGSEKAH